MNDTEIKKRTKAITILLTAFDKGGDKNMISVYVTATKDIPVDVLEAACKKLMTESESRPVPATIIKAAKELIACANGTDAPPFAEVWKEIMQQLHETYFDWEEGEYSRKEIEQLVKCFGGLRGLRMMTTAETPIIRAQMNKAYDGICAKNKERQMNSYILGATVLVEDNNTARAMLK